MMRGAPVRFKPIHQCDGFIIHMSRQQAGQADSIQVCSTDVVGQNGLCVPVLPNVETLIIDKYGNSKGVIGWGQVWPIETLPPDYVGYVTMISISNGTHYSITSRLGYAVRFTYHDGESEIDSGRVVFCAEDCTMDEINLKKRSCFTSTTPITICGKCISFTIEECDPRIRK